MSKKKHPLYIMLVKAYQQVTKQKVVKADQIALENSLKTSIDSAIRRFNLIGVKKIQSDPFMKASIVAMPSVTPYSIKETLNKRNKITQQKKKEVSNISKESSDDVTEPNSMESTVGVDSFSGSDAFLKVGDVLRVLEERLGPAVSSHGGSKIVHASIKDRFILWVLLVGLILCSFAGYFFAS